jgi:uncharacterized protein with PQ loop repeat
MNHNPRFWLETASAAQFLVPLLSLTAYIPQWRKLIRTGDSSSISLMSWCIWVLSYSIAVFYSVTLLVVTGHGLALVVTTVLGLCFVIFTVALVLRYRRR